MACGECIMPAKNIWAGKPDVQVSFAAHIEPGLRAHRWVTKWLALRDTGKAKQAASAERKARRWLRKAMLLEARVDIGESDAHLPGRD
jgi:hypothetical protein